LIVRARNEALRRLCLVLAGVDRGVGATLETYATEHRQPDALVRLGTAVDDAQLARLYRAAKALIYPSRYEGFGLPLVEAMACGTPVVAARASATPEVAGGAAVLVEPGNARAFADALEALLLDASKTAELRAAGLRRASTLKWERTAAETVAAYRRCVSEVGRRR
jgi:glycosyltransferase involved in cell wall biosynthesis